MIKGCGFPAFSMERPGGGEDSAYERGGDAHRLAWGCKFRILGVLGKTPSYLAMKVSFRVAREKI